MGPRPTGAGVGVTFGLGRHSCLGKSLAIAELLEIVAVLGNTGFRSSSIRRCSPPSGTTFRRPDEILVRCPALDRPGGLTVPQPQVGVTGGWTVPAPLDTVEVRMADGAPIVLRAPRQSGRLAARRQPRLRLGVRCALPLLGSAGRRFDLVVHDFRNHGWNPVGNRRTHNFATFVRDNEDIVRAIDAHFGEKQKIGVFHSMSALTALLQSTKGKRRHGYSALVLFDLPVCPPGGDPKDMVAVGAEDRHGRPVAPGQIRDQTGIRGDDSSLAPVRAPAARRRRPLRPDNPPPRRRRHRVRAVLPARLRGAGP